MIKKTREDIIKIGIILLSSVSISAIFIGCKESNTELKSTENEVQTQIVIEQKKKPHNQLKHKETLDSEDSKFPEQIEYEKGRVKFKCTLDIPGEFNEESTCEYVVERRIFVDRKKAYAKYVEGKEIVEQYNIPEGNGLPTEDIYFFPNEESATIGVTFSYGSKYSKYYAQIGVENKPETFSNNSISAVDEKDCILEVKMALTELGYAGEEFLFSAFPLNSQAMKQLEDEYVQQGMLKNENRKAFWSKEDDAYMIYAFQSCGGIPVFHEFMGISHQMAYDTPDAAPVQAIYSSRGLEFLMVSSLYKMVKSERILEFKDIEEIIKVVEEKFNNILNDLNYVVTRAKLYQMVHLDKEQKYIADPIWYFEVIDNEGNSNITLVNAVTGKEIFLP